MANSGAAPSHVRHRTRDFLATYFLESGYDIRTVQEILGRKDVKTTTLYPLRGKQRSAVRLLYEHCRKELG